MDRRDMLLHFVRDDLLVGSDGQDIGYDDDLLMSGLVNSLGIMRLVSYVQEEFGITIPAQDITIDHFETIAALDAYLKTRSTAE